MFTKSPMCVLFSTNATLGLELLLHSLWITHYQYIASKLLETGSFGSSDAKHRLKLNMSVCELVTLLASIIIIT